MRREAAKMTSPLSGFTLLEVLISLTLLTIVLGAVYSSFFSVHNVLERFENVSLKYHEARTALDIIRREIESAVIINSGPDMNDTFEDQTAFVIRDRDIMGKSASGLSLTSFSFKGSGLNTVSYYVEEKNGKLDLLKKEAPTAIQSGEYTMEVIEAIDSVSIETLFNDKWVRTWDSKNTGRLPDNVRVTVEFDDNGKKVKLTEYARPKVGKKL